MSKFDAFVSVVMVVRDRQNIVEPLLRAVSEQTQCCLRDYEIVVVDNGSTDGTVGRLESLVHELPNVQVYCLVKPCDDDVALIAGLENSIGDYVLVLDPHAGAAEALPRFLESAISGHDVVYGENRQETECQGQAYKLLRRTFFGLYRLLTGQSLPLLAARNRVMSRSVVNYLLQHPNAHLLYRIMPATLVGFKSAVVSYDGTSTVGAKPRRALKAELHKGLTLLLSSSTVPMRITTLLCLTGAVLNILYSVYVMGIHFFKEDVAPGWVTLSLQTSGMFFLFSLVLAILSEYILRVLANSAREPLFHVAREFGSEQMSRREKLNVLRDQTLIHTRRHQ